LLCISAMIVPGIILLVLIGQFFITKVKIPTIKSQIKYVNGQIEASQDYIDEYNKITNQKKFFNDCMGELAFAVNRQTAWTPILSKVVFNMPGQLVMEEMSAVSKSFTERVPSKDDKDKMVSVSRLKKVVEMTFIADINPDPENEMTGYIKTLRDLGLKVILKNSETIIINESEFKKYQVEFVLEQT
jgi:hypothetical protein